MRKSRWFLFVLIVGLSFAGALGADPPSLVRPAALPQGLSMPTLPGPTLRAGVAVVDKEVLGRSERVTLHLFDDLSLVVDRIGLEKRPPFGDAWFGVIADRAGTESPGGRVTAIVTRKGLTADIRWGNRVFMIFPTASGLHVVQEVDPLAFPPEKCLEGAGSAGIGGAAGKGPVVGGATQHPGGTQHPGATTEPGATSHATPETGGEEATVVPFAAPGADTANALLVCPSPPPPPPPGQEIDVLVVYTDDVGNVYADMEGQAVLAVEVTNQAYANSQVHQRLRLLDARMVQYDDDNTDPLGDLANSTHPQLGVAHTWREECGADLVDLWVLELGNNCGTASVKGPACQETVFSVTRADCAIGSYSFAHELGHNMGSQHNHEDAGTTPAYTFSYGLRNPAAGFRTIMAYNSSGCCVRIGHFSNPNVCVTGPAANICPCGTPGCYATGIPAGQSGAADNAQSLNLTAQLVSAQRTATGQCLIYPCQTDAQCDDGNYCTGVETCVDSVCQGGTGPCPVLCRESDDACVDCLLTADCTDDLFCNGLETCDAKGSCQFGSDPCPGQFCKEPQDVCTAGAQVWISFIAKTAVPGVGNVENEDVVVRDAVTGAWSLVFDGSDVGLSSLTIDGLAVLPSGDILLSFTDAKSIPTMTGGPSGSTTLDDSDIVRFIPTSLGANTAGSLVFFFDGSDVGLTTNDEDIDAIALNAISQLLISTVGPVTADGASGADTDLLIFSGESFGEATAGTFSTYFDGSDVDLTDGGNEDIDAAAYTPSRKLLLSTLGAFAVTGVSGQDEDLLQFALSGIGPDTFGTYSMYLDLSTLGIPDSADVGGVEFLP